MPNSVYKVIELVGTSAESWEKAAKTAVDTAAKTLRDLRIAEVEQLDMQLKDGKVEAYRAKVKVSFKFEGRAQLRVQASGFVRARRMARAEMVAPIHPISCRVS